MYVPPCDTRAVQQAGLVAAVACVRAGVQTKYYIPGTSVQKKKQIVVLIVIFSFIVHIYTNTCVQVHIHIFFFLSSRSIHIFILRDFNLILRTYFSSKSQPQTSPREELTREEDADNGSNTTATATTTTTSTTAIKTNAANLHT